MQELKYETVLRQEKKEQYPVPENTPGISLSVKRNLKSKAVILEVGMNSVSMTIQGARDLALALRQNANFVEKNQ